MKALIALMLMTVSTMAAEAWWTKIDVAPVAVLQTKDINGASQFGAGVDLGLRVNPWVSVRVVNLAYEQEDWGGSVIDETDLLVRADITALKYNSFTPYFIGGGLYEYETKNFGMSAGLGGQFNFSKNVGIGADYSIQFMEEGSKRSLAKAYLKFSF